MIECAIFHNGSSDLPLTRSPEGFVYNKGSLADQHRSAQRGINAQVRQAVLADQLGFDFWFQTEHHFQIDGNERNSSTLAVESAIAVLTDQIRIGQMANILPWWHPIRLASYVATLDILSGGRAEFGVGRGYQSREAETLGQLLGTTTMDEEKNRLFYEEAYEVILQAWTEDSFSHHGDFISVPPPWTKWNNDHTVAVFSDPDTGYPLENVLNLGKNGPEGMGGLPIYNTTTTVREISVLPQPLQKPHPQVWSPVTSDRSVAWAAAKGINAYFASESTKLIKQRMAVYAAECEKAGWPDYLNRGEFKYGWDAERKRGIVPGRFIHVTEPGVGRKESVIADSVNANWSYFHGFGFLKYATGKDPVKGQYYDTVKEIGLCYVGSNQEVIDSILEMKEYCGYGEDLLLGCWFEHASLLTEEVETQMRNFAENILPVLEKELNGRNPKPPVPSLIPART